MRRVRSNGVYGRPFLLDCDQITRYFQSLALVAEQLADAIPYEPYAAMVKKRNAVAAHGLSVGAAVYAAASTRRLSVSRLPFVAANVFAKASASEFRLIEPRSGSYILQPPDTIGPNDAIPLHGRARTMFLARIDDAVVESRSYILRANGVAVGDIEEEERVFDDCPELDAAVFAVDGDAAYIIDDYDAPTLQIDEAFVSLLGPHSSAFGHWIWHQLPRLILALDRGELAGMPILIESGMPASHREALELIIGDRQMPIIEVPFFGRVEIRHAWYMPMPFLMPYLPIPNKRWNWGFIGPSSERFKPILATMHESVLCSKAFVPSENPHSRVYLKRRQGLHRVLQNAAEVEAIFRKHGFAIVDPESLTFFEQASLMASADIVAGPEGSAMFLNFYRRPQSRLLILCHPFTRHLTNWTATLAARSIETMILTGSVVTIPEANLPPAARLGYKYFVDYEIDSTMLHNVLDDLYSAK